MSSITVQKVAKLAGVSAATVSRCLHSPHLVREATLQKVRQVMRENNYIYNIMAADFSRRRSSAVGVIIPTPAASAFAQTLVGIQEATFERNAPLFVGSTHYRPELERGLLRQCLEHRLGGVLMAGFDPSNADLVRELQANGIACVILWEKPDDPLLHCVGIDNYQSVRNALDYLFSIGHRRIAAVLGPLETSNRTRHRLQAYRDALESRGIPYDPELVLFKGPFLLPGKEAVTRLLSLREAPTAIFAGSDLTAVSIISELKGRGVRVPEDISICGFDDNEVSAYLTPPLTSVRVPSAKMGRLGMSFLLELPADFDRLPPRRLLLDTEFVIRRSCAPPVDGTGAPFQS